MDIVIAIIELLLAIVIWWDCTVQLGGLNNDLYENRSEWRKKTLKHLKRFFPRMNKIRSTKKIIPSELYIVIYNFQIAVHTLFLLWIANSAVSLILFLVGVKFQVMRYYGLFTLTVIFLCEILVGIASFVCSKECKRLQKKRDDIKKS